MIEPQPAWAEPVQDLGHLLPWVRLPSRWIEDGGLSSFRWERSTGANNVAALMALAVIAHHANQETGYARLTWDDLCDHTYLSRAKLAKGLDILSGLELLERKSGSRSNFRLANFDPASGWAMLPARGLYGRQGYVTAFRDFTLRLRAELDALKIYFLMASRRDRKSNAALLAYDKISEYSGVNHNNIRSALSLLAGHNLVHISTLPSELNQYGIANQYRLAHLETRRHAGTVGRVIE